MRNYKAGQLLLINANLCNTQLSIINYQLSIQAKFGFAKPITNLH